LSPRWTWATPASFAVGNTVTDRVVHTATAAAGIEGEGEGEGEGDADGVAAGIAGWGDRVGSGARDADAAADPVVPGCSDIVDGDSPNAHPATTKASRHAVKR
jgi:hypothetical protein